MPIHIKATELYLLIRYVFTVYLKWNFRFCLSVCFFPFKFRTWILKELENIFTGVVERRCTATKLQYCSVKVVVLSKRNLKLTRKKDCLLKLAGGLAN